jgi:hypothetical protein
MLNQQPNDLGIFGPRMASTLVQPWTPTAASSLSMQTPRAKSYPTQLNSDIPIFPSRLHLPKTKSFMAFRLSPVQLLVRRRPQASPKSNPLPTFETYSNHGDYSCLPPSSHLESRCLAIQGCQHRTLQGWYRLHRRHWPTRLWLAHRGVHRPDQQALRSYHLL